MKTTKFKHCPSSARGFSLVELVGLVAILAILATVGLTTFRNTKSAASNTKLISDVTKLNSLVTMYQASGGSLAQAVTAQDVIDKLKTVRGTVDAKKTVGPVTGRAVDVRLVARMQTADEAASKASRVRWNSEKLKFEIDNSGAAGVASFALDNTLADKDFGIEARTASNVTYNENDGWVWKNDNSQGQPFLSPLDATLSNAGGNTYVPTDPGGGGGPPVATQLPAPSITPRGGSFFLSNFVTSVTINQGLLVSGSGSPAYNVIREDGTSTGWIPYTAPFSITYGDTVVARNTSNNPVLYTDSPSATENYALQPTVLTAPRITPRGGSYLASAWPGVTIDANGSPVGPYTAISYRITSADGVNGTWKTYTGPIATTYGDKVTAKNISLNPKFYTDSGTVANTYKLTGSTKLPPPLFTQTTESNEKKWITIYPDNSKMPIPAGARIFYTTNGTDPGVNLNEDPLPGAIAYTPGSPVAAKPNGGNSFNIIARLYPPTADKASWDTSNSANISISMTPPVFSGNIAAKWNPSSGTSKLVSSIDNSNPDSVVEKDGEAKTEQNSFIFKRQATFSGVPANTTFKIGKIYYHNGTIKSDTGSEELSLHLDLALSNPSVGTTGIDIAMLLNNSKNSGGGKNELSADACTLANPVTTYTVQVGGWTYALTLKYGEISSTQGYISGNTLNVWEGASGEVDILAEFTLQ